MRRPKLCLFNDNLYSFFENTYNKQNVVIEMINLLNEKAKWINVTLKSPTIHIRLLHCGVVKLNRNQILFLGEERNKKGIVEFNFLNMQFKEKSITFYNNSEERWKFKDPNFIYLGKKAYGQFDDNSNFINYTFNCVDTPHVINLDD